MRNRLTVNQLVTLLTIHRGTPLDEIRCGTTVDDLRVLRAAGFISDEGADLQTTALGSDAVARASASATRG